MKRSGGSAGSSRGSASPANEQPATPSHLKILSIRDVQRWLAEEPIASCSSADMQRIREAVAVLSHPKPRQEDVQPLQSKWQVARQKDKKKRPLGDVLQELRDKVIKATQKLQQQLADGAEQRALPGSSTDRADAQNDPAAGGEDPVPPGVPDGEL